MDVATYCVETMFDVAHPGQKGIKHYIENCIKDNEQEILCREYLTTYYRKYYPLPEGEQRTPENEQRYVENELPKFLDEVRRCMILNNFFSSLWPMKKFEEEKFGDPSVFYFDYALGRTEIHNYLVQKYFAK